MLWRLPVVRVRETMGTPDSGVHVPFFVVASLALNEQVASGVLTVGDMTSFLLYSTFLALNFGGLTGVYSQVSVRARRAKRAVCLGGEPC